jgi:hypothetical protein
MSSCSLSEIIVVESDVCYRKKQRVCFDRSYKGIQEKISKAKMLKVY